MTDTSRPSAPGGPMHRHVEIGVAIAMILFGAAVILGSYLAGIGWSAEGPRSGFIPFWIGVLIAMASTVNLVRIIVVRSDAKLFADWHQLGQVLLVVAPLAVYVSAVPFVGIYVASIFLIGAFMRHFGRYSWGAVALASLGVPLMLFIAFERWFMVPLPKGPLEDLLGY